MAQNIENSLRDSPEITDEMISSALHVYLQYCPDTGVGDHLDRTMVAEMLVAAIKEYRDEDDREVAHQSFAFVPLRP